MNEMIIHDTTTGAVYREVQGTDENGNLCIKREIIKEGSAAPTQLDIIEAQVTYTAMMTDTLLGG